MSVKEIKLTKPLLINGKEVSTLTYDVDEISIEDVTRAEMLKTKLGGVVTGNLFHNDYALHICIGIRAIIAINKDIAEEDLLRIKGYDINLLAVAGMLFFVKQEQSEESNLEKPQEDMQDTITAQ